MSDKTIISYLWLFLCLVVWGGWTFYLGLCFGKKKLLQDIRKKQLYIDWLEREVRKYQFERGTK